MESQKRARSTARFRTGAAITVAGTAAMLALALLLRRGDPCAEAVDSTSEAVEQRAWASAEIALNNASRVCGYSPPPKLAELRRKIETHLADVRPAATAKSSTQVAAEEAIDAAGKVWYAYMKLPAEKQTKDAWKDAVAESNAKGAELAPPYDETFRRENAAFARKYAAPLLTGESRATGTDFSVLIPSDDPVKCAVWASQWSADPESFHTLGFKKLRCEATTHTSKVTGNPVTEPAQEWTIP